MRDDVRLPRALFTDMTEMARLHPTALSLDLYLRACPEAKMTLPAGDERLENMPFVNIYTARGSAGIFRVYDSTETIDGQRTYTLRHAIDTLRDSVWREKTRYAGTVSGFLTALLSWQTVPRWQLGACEDMGSYKREINYDHLDKLLDELREREGYYFSYDFSTTPWTLHFLALSGTVEAEMRLTRNLNDASLRRTRNGMANRLFLAVDGGDPTQYDDSASQRMYGVVEGTAGVTSEEAPDPAVWAAAWFADHARPIASVSGDAYEIVKATGEPWDAFDIGKRVRVAAPGVPGYPVALPLEALRYEDLAGAEPEKARAELKKRLPKFSEQLSRAQKKADSADSASQETQDALSAAVTRLDAQKADKLTQSAALYLYVGAAAPTGPIEHGILWIVPGSTAGADGALPCEVKYIP